jgi:hypothetical protein
MNAMQTTRPIPICNRPAGGCRKFPSEKHDQSFAQSFIDAIRIQQSLTSALERRVLI